MFYKIPVTNGQPDIDHTTDFFEDSRIVDIAGKDGSVSQVMYGKLMSGNKKETWTEITEEEFYQIVAKPVVSKQTSQLDRMEERLQNMEKLMQNSAELQSFYDEVIEEAGL